MTDDVVLQVHAEQLRRYCWYGLLALLAWMAVEAAVLAPAGLSPLTLLLGWLFRSLALLLFLRGIHAGRARSAVWLAFVLLFYFVMAALGAFAPGLPGLMGIVEAVLIAGLFILAIRFVKAKRATQGGAL